MHSLITRQNQLRLGAVLTSVPTSCTLPTLPSRRRLEEVQTLPASYEGLNALPTTKPCAPCSVDDRCACGSGDWDCLHPARSADATRKNRRESTHLQVPEERIFNESHCHRSAQVRYLFRCASSN